MLLNPQIPCSHELIKVLVDFGYFLVVLDCIVPGLQKFAVGRHVSLVKSQNCVSVKVDSNIDVGEL